MKFDRQIMKGHLKVILLAVLSDGPCHAYGINKKIEDKSLGVFSLSEGTVYPTLHKLEKDGLIESTWQKRDKGPDVRNYHISNRGKKFLEESKQHWRYFFRAMNLILDSEK